MPSTFIIGSTTTMRSANIGHTRVDKLGTSQKFGADLRDVFKLHTPKAVSLSSDTETRRGSAAALGERLVESKSKSSASSLEKRYNSTSATLGKTDHTDQSQREAIHGECESEGRLIPIREDGNGRGKELRDSGAENSEPDRPETKTFQSMGSVMVSEQDWLAVETVISESPTSSPPTASPFLVNDLPGILTGGNPQATQPAPPPEAEKELLRTGVADSATKAPPDLVEATENKSVSVTKLYGEAVERSSELPVAFTLNFKQDSIRPVNSQLLQLRNHLAMRMATPQEAVALDQSQILQSGAVSIPFEPNDLNLTSISLDALRRHAMHLTQRDEVPSSESPRTVTGAIEQGETVGLGNFSSVSEKEPFSGRLSKIESTHSVEQIGTVSEGPITKRPVSQLILKFGDEANSSVSVRLNSRNAGLRMEVLGGDQQLRDSLRGSLSFLEKALERHSLDSGWKAIGSVPPTESLPSPKEVTSGYPYDRDPNQRNGSRDRQEGRTPHGGSTEGQSKDERRKGGGGGPGNGKVDLFSLGALGTSAF